MSGSTAAAKYSPQLQSMIKTTRAMVAHAKKGDWDALVKLDDQRQLDLNRCFDSASSEDNGFAISELIALNDHLISLVNAERGNLSEEFHQFKARRQGLTQYQATAASD